MKKILLLGASGSIGSQTLDIIKQYPKEFILTAFSVGEKVEFIDQILSEHTSVKHVYLLNKNYVEYFSNKYPDVEFFTGKSGLVQITKKSIYDVCVNALVGFCGFEPAVSVLKQNKILCLANKEALVVGGEIINKLLSKGYGRLYPIDSEHVALAKCLSKCNPEDVKNLIITASGGALRNVPIDKLNEQTPEDALRHPTWKMGSKITIDCATMMNKGFEIIEAYYLYHYPLDQIKVLMHDESLVHSIVELKDGTFIVDYGKPDMHEPIRYALFEGKSDFSVKVVKSLDELKDCHFHEYNPERYPCTELAKEALQSGVSKMIALNAANEIAVNKFLNHEIKYNEIYEITHRVVSKQHSLSNCSISLIKTIDRYSRLEAKK